MKDHPDNHYQAGHCNIGQQEIRLRLRNGYYGLALSIIFILAAETFQLSQVFKLLLFFPLLFCISGFLQAYHKHCFVYGYLGLFSIDDVRKKVGDDYARLKDRRKAFSLLGQVVIASLIITFLYFYTS